MNLDYELSLFNVNPMRFVTETSRSTYRLSYTYMYNNKGRYVQLSEHSNVIDALSARDAFVKEWYGGLFSNKLENLRNGILDTDDKYIMIGGYYFNRNGKILNSLFKEYSPEHVKNGVSVFRLRAIHNNVNRSLYLSSSDLLNIFKGHGLVTISKNKNLYIRATGNSLIISDERDDSIIYKDRDRARKKSGAVYFNGKILGVKNIFPDSYQARIVVDKKEHYIGSATTPTEAQLLFFDAYYLFRGALHKEDNRGL